MGSSHWNDVYSKKNETEVSWFQQTPATSLKLIQKYAPETDFEIIDVGAGESRLFDHLLDLEYDHLTALDISAVAMGKLKERLGTKVQYVVSDITEFKPAKQFQVWHDRAAFHFLTNKQDIETYVKISSDAIRKGGHLIISTFSKTGPEKCSGLQITQYSADNLKALFSAHFDLLESHEETHVTPWDSSQNFVYCVFRKRD